MNQTVYIPDELDEKFDEYLKNNPGETHSSVMQEAMESKLACKDISELLAMAGIVQDAPRDARDRAEDSVVTEEKP